MGKYVCPHCGSDVKRVEEEQGDTWKIVSVSYVCPKCERKLDVFELVYVDGDEGKV